MAAPAFSHTAFDALEAERAVVALRPLAPDALLQLGSDTWLEERHTFWHRANAAVHAAVSTSSDDFTTAALLTHDKLSIAVEEVIAGELWRTHCLHRMLPRIAAAASTGPLRAYFVLFHEATVLNFLETVLFHDYVAEALGDSLLDLVDYLVRQVNTLIAATLRARDGGGSGSGARALRGHKHSSSSSNHGAGADDDAADEEGEEEDGGLLDDDDSSVSYTAPDAAKVIAARLEARASNPSRAARTQLAAWRRQLEFSIGVSSVAILRFLADHIARLPLSVMARITDTHDVPLLMVPLIENPPWVRKVARAGKPLWQKYVSGRWTDVAPTDLLKLTPSEAQPWLCLYALLLTPDSRKRYALHSHRKSTLARVRKYLNEVLVDQVPLLAGLQRTLDEMSVIAAPETVDVTGGRLLLETVPVIAERLTRGAWRAADAHAPASKLSSATAAVTSSSARDRGAAAESMESKESKESKEAGDVHDVRDSSAHELLTAEPAPARSILRILPDAADAAASASATGGRASATGAPPCSSAESGNAKEAEGEEAAWARVSEHIGRTVFSPTASAAALRRLTSVWGDDAAMEELLGQPKCNKCGAEAPRRCARCKNIWYCSRECQVADWPSHKPMCDVVAAHALPHD